MSDTLPVQVTDHLRLSQHHGAGYLLDVEISAWGHSAHATLDRDQARRLAAALLAWVGPELRQSEPGAP